MTRPAPFTQAQVRRAVKAAESAGLRVKSVTVRPDGSITVDSSEATPPVSLSFKNIAASWDDA